MLSTHTRSSRVATWPSELTPTKYLKSPTPCLYMVVSSGCLSGGDAHARRHLLAAAGPHPLVHRLRVQHHLAHVGVEAEEVVRHAQSVERVAHRTHAAHQIRPAAADHHVEGRRPVLAEVLA